MAYAEGAGPTDLTKIDLIVAAVAGWTLTERLSQTSSSSNFWTRLSLSSMNALHPSRGAQQILQHAGDHAPVHSACVRRPGTHVRVRVWRSVRVMQPVWRVYYRDYIIEIIIEVIGIRLKERAIEIDSARGKTSTDTLTIA